jgi:hypothetical protein
VNDAFLTLSGAQARSPPPCVALTPRTPSDATRTHFLTLSCAQQEAPQRDHGGAPGGAGRSSADFARGAWQPQPAPRPAAVSDEALQARACVVFVLHTHVFVCVVAAGLAR